jgi:hypothetical protein
MLQLNSINALHPPLETKAIKLELEMLLTILTLVT